MTKLITILTVLMVSCSTINQVEHKGNGKVTQKVHKITGFNKLDLNVTFNVTMIPANEEKVVIETDNNLHELVLVEKQDSTLVIKMKNNDKIKKTVGEIKIYYTQINEIKNVSVGDLKCQEMIEAEKFKFKNSSVGNSSLQIIANEITVNNRAVGNTTLKGTCKELFINNSAVGNLLAKGFECQTLHIRNKAVGNTIINAQKEMYIKNRAVGKLEVYGEGVIKEITNNSVGKFVKH